MAAPLTNQIKVYANGTKLPTISASDAVSIEVSFDTEETISDIGQVARGIKRKVQNVKVKVLLGSDTQAGIMNSASVSPALRSIILNPQNQFNLTLTQGSNSVSGIVAIKMHGDLTALPSDTFEMTFISLGTDFRAIYNI